MEVVRAKLDSHDKQLQKVEERLQALAADPDRSTNTADNVARNQYAALELKIEAEVRRLSSRISSSTASSSSTSAPPSAAPPSAAPPLAAASATSGNISVLGGIGENTPAEEALRIAKEFLHHVGVLPAVPAEAPYRLTSAVHFKFPCPDACPFIPAIRNLPTRGYEGRQFWATVRATKEWRPRNLKLLRAAEALHRQQVGERAE